MSGIRVSKYKHVFGKALKREECYDSIRITKSSWDSCFCSVNPKFLAIITEAAGGGAFLVVPLEHTGRVPPNTPIVTGHTAAVLDLQWCPHNDNLIASASEDCTAKVWEIPDSGLEENLVDPVANLVGHQRRVGLVVWHPTAEHVLLTSGADNLVIIWNLSTCTQMVEISFTKMVHCASFNYDGSSLVTSCKDGLTRIVNPRTGELIQEGKCHEGAKPQQVIYLKGKRLFTTGFSRMSERQFALWNDSDLSKPLMIEELDTSNGIIFPFYDHDCNIIYLCGKGDSSIRYFEYSVEEGAVYYLNRLDSSSPQRGMGFMPKRGLNVNANEIGRFYKLHNSNWVEVIPFIVPRRSGLFQDDLYPDAVSSTPAMTAEEWFGGKNADPILVSMKNSFHSNANTIKHSVSSLTPGLRSKMINNEDSAASKTDSDKSQFLDTTQKDQRPVSTLAVPTPQDHVGSGNFTDADYLKLIEQVNSMTSMIGNIFARLTRLENKIESYHAASADFQPSEDTQHTPV